MIRADWESSPFDKARAVYWSEPCARTFEDDLHTHFRSGFVFSTPDYFIMGRPVPHDAPHREIVDPSFSWMRKNCDCWHVYLMAGEITAGVFRIMPWPLPWISFERHNRIRFVRASRMAELFNHITTPKP